MVKVCKHAPDTVVTIDYGKLPNGSNGFMASYRGMTGGGGSRLEALGSLLAGFPEAFGVHLMETDAVTKHGAELRRKRRK